jgi:hypothetical protein
MNFNEAISHLFERSNAMQSFWGFYISIAGALLAFFGTGKRSKYVTRILLLLFIVIAGVNLNGMSDVAKQRQMLRGLVERTFCAVVPSDRRRSLDGELEACRAADSFAAGHPLLPSPPDGQVIEGLLRTVHPPPVWAVVATHLLFDAAVLAAIWFLQRERRTTVSDRPAS